MRRLIIVLAAALLVVAAPVLANQVIPQADDFESYQLGTYFTTSANIDPSLPVSDVWGDSAQYLAGSRWDIVETAELDGNPNNQVVHVVDVPNSTTKNEHLRTNFWDATERKTTGVYTTMMDVMPLSTDAAFKITMTDGTGWTSAKNWLCAVSFGSDTSAAYFPGMSVGANIGLQTVALSATWADTSFTYQANTWYTVQFVVDVDAKTYQAYFGPHGGSLAELTSGPTAWIPGALSTPTTFDGIFFATSNVAGEGGEFLVDNVRCVPEPSGLVALAIGGVGLLGSLRRRRISR